MKSKELSQWKETRKKGKWKFISINGVLCFGVPMFFANSFLFGTKPFKNGFTVLNVTTNVAIWLFVGLFFGISLWFLNEYRFKKISKIDNQADAGS